MFRTIVLLFLMCLGGCAIRHVDGYERPWAYMEDWDQNRNSKLDESEFISGYSDAGFFSTWGSRSKRIPAQELTAKLESSNEKLKQSLVTSPDWTASASRNDTSSTSEGNAQLAVIVAEIDTNSDHIVTREEWAKAMFILADENNDNVVNGIEFYLWQMLRS